MQCNARQCKAIQKTHEQISAVHARNNGTTTDRYKSSTHRNNAMYYTLGISEDNSDIPHSRRMV